MTDLLKNLNQSLDKFQEVLCGDKYKIRKEKKINIITKDGKHSIILNDSNENENKGKNVLYNRINKVRETEREKLLQHNFNEKEKMLNFLRSKVETFHSMLLKREHIIDLLNRSKAISIDSLSLLDVHALFLSYSSIFLPMVPYITDNKFTDLEEVKVLTNLILQPLKVTQDSLVNDVSYYSYTGIINDSNVRYIPHWSYRSLVGISELSKVNNSKNVDGNNIENHDIDMKMRRCKDSSMVANIYLRLFYKISLQQRYGNIPKQILSFAFCKQEQCEREYLSNVPFLNQRDELVSANNSICFAVLINIIKFYNGLPFYTKRMTRDEEVFARKGCDFSIQLPVIIACLLNGFTEEILGNLDYHSAKLFIDNIAWCITQPSLTQGQLSLKNMFRPLFKLLQKECDIMPIVTRSSSGIANSLKIVRQHEFFLVGEEDRLIKQFEKLPYHLRAFFQECKLKVKKIKALLNDIYVRNGDIIIPNCRVHKDDVATVSKCLEFFRYTLMQFNTITNFGLFHKTFLSLDFSKSTGTKVMYGITDPKVEEVILINNNKIPFKFKWDDVESFRLLNRKFNNEWMVGITKYLEDIGSITNLFVMNLTNRSGGVKTIDPNLPKELQNITNARIISFLVNMDKFNRMDTFIEMMNTIGKCSVRYQVDRRGRIIVIVSNAYQTLDVVLLAAFNFLKTSEIFGKSMAVGKQIGGILDATSQLIASSDMTLIKDSTDISGMDAHTLPTVTKFLRSKVIECLHQRSYDRIEHERYFTCGTCETTFFKNDNRCYSYTDIVSGAAQHCAFVLNSFYPLKLELDSGVGLNDFRISEATFWSGLFGTSAQHTMFLALLLESSLEDFNSKMCRTGDRIQFERNLNVNFRIMGDDILSLIKVNLITEDDVRKWIGFLVMKFRDFNYSVEPELSYFNAQFLQQVAYCGVYIPLPARITIVCDEKSETLFRHPIDVTKIVLDISLSKAQRSYGINNIVSIGNCVWQSLRSHKLRNKNADKVKSTIDKVLDSQVLNKRFFEKISNECLQVTYPYVTIFTNPTNWPMPAFLVKSSKLGTEDKFLLFEKTSVTTLQGSSSLFHINKMFSKNSLLRGGTQSDIKLILNTNWDLRNDFGFTLGEHLNKYFRIRHLSEIRRVAIGANMDILANNLSVFLGRDRILKSMHAISELRKIGISFPDDMAYANFAKKKIEQSLISRLESLDETGELDLKFFTYLRKFNKIPYKSTLREYQLANIIIARTSEELDFTFSNVSTHDLLINKYIPILPGYHIRSDFGKLYQYVGMPLGQANVKSYVGTITEQLGASFDIDSAVDYGIRIKLQNNNAIGLVAEALGLNEKSAYAYEKLVDQYGKLGIRTKYQSVYKPANFFAINGDLDVGRAHVSLESGAIIDTLNKGLVSQVMKAWTRDALFMYVNNLDFKKIRLIISPEAILVGGTPGLSLDNLNMFMERYNLLYGRALNEVNDVIG
nr:MAG: RNA-dependent RNA polymerase [Bat faecal associated reovirus 6]